MEKEYIIKRIPKNPLFSQFLFSFPQYLIESPIYPGSVKFAKEIPQWKLRVSSLSTMHCLKPE